MRHLYTAAQTGDVETLKRVVRTTNAQQNTEALTRAAMWGQSACVQLLIPISHPPQNDSYALRVAASNGHAQCVALLIPVSNPKAYNSGALYDALVNKHEQCAEMLYDVCNLSEVLIRLEQSSVHHDIVQYLTQRMKADQEHAIIQENIDDTQHATLRKKM